MCSQYKWQSAHRIMGDACTLHGRSGWSKPAASMSGCERRPVARTNAVIIDKRDACLG